MYRFIRLAGIAALAITAIVTLMATVSSAEPLPDTDQAVAGGAHSCAVTTDGEVRCWGKNTSGQLGDGTTTATANPSTVVAVDGPGPLTGVDEVALGSNHSCALHSAGEVVCWGNNSAGQLGTGTTTNSAVPTPVVVGDGQLSGVKQLSAGAFHTCALLTTGRVTCWGANYFGQLGNGGTDNSSAPVVVAAVGGGPELSNVKAVVTGAFHTCALLTNGRVACWGANFSGLLGDGTALAASTPVMTLTADGDELAGVRQLAAGSFHTCALQTDTGAACWGSNSSGQAGDGTTATARHPVPVVGIEGEGELRGVEQLSAGGGHTCALTTDGEVVCWGTNRSGQLGDGTTEVRTMPVVVQAVDGGGPLGDAEEVSAGGNHACARLGSSRIVCWGNNERGQLGDWSTTDRPLPVAVPVQLTAVRQGEAGGAHTCALLTDGRVGCWGSNSTGQLGTGTTDGVGTLVMVTAPGGEADLGDIREITAGQTHTCALSSGGGVTCWGSNFSGQLGDGTTDDRAEPATVEAVGGGGELSAVRQVVAGAFHTCALSTTGRVSCWGANGSGQLGDGTTTNRTAPAAVLDAAGDELTNVTHLSAGSFHTCAVLGTGRIACWGNNFFGQLGDGTTSDRTAPVTVIDGDGDGQLAGGRQAAAGSFHTCVLTNQNRVHCWGANFSGQLGDGSATDADRPVPVVDGESQLSNIKEIASGANHACALTLNGQVRCWGADSAGQLGHGAVGDSAVPVTVLTPGGGGELATVKGLTADGNHTCALLNSTALVCWGANGGGQLGDGTTVAAGWPVRVATTS